jgi:hypothetical protein
MNMPKDRSDNARGRATVRFVLADEQEGMVVVDAVVQSSTGGGTLPAPGQPVTLPLMLPEPSWMGDALRDLLIEWVEADALVHVEVLRGRHTLLARLGCEESVMSLALAGTSVD